MDQDISTALAPASGSSNTIMEKLYALAVQDSRNFRSVMQAQLDWFKQSYDQLPPEEQAFFNDKDRLYLTCLQMGMDARKQTMSTTTSRTLMDDVVDDAFYIANKLYARVKAEKAAGNL